MSETERRYAQVEKEALAVTWACEKFTDDLSSKQTLIPLLNSKQLDNMPPRILIFRLRLSRYNYDVQNVPGKYLYTADALSRAPVAGSCDNPLQEGVETFVDSVVEHSLPITEQRLKI